MSNKTDTWKDVERWVAKLLGGKRVPVSGRTGKEGMESPDVEHPWMSIEVKYRQKISKFIDDSMAQAFASSQDGYLLPIVVLVAKNRTRTDNYVIMKIGDFVEWFGDE